MTDMKGVSTMTDLDKNISAELSDEELDQVVGGVSVGDRVKMDSYMVRYCPGCGKLAMYSYGTIVGKTWYEREQHYFLDIKTDCCGHIEKRADFACELY